MKGYQAVPPPAVKCFTEYLRAAGYYCTNNSKTDYNTTPVDLETIWDESGKDAHYRKRNEGQPFFAIFNITTSHESSIHKSTPSDQLRHRPEDVTLPPYHPDTPEMRHDWAQYYDKVEDMDAQVGEFLRQLDEAGLAENTIVFYYGDHGGVLGRSKRFLYETGTHVPMIIRIPEKYKNLYPSSAPGSKVERLVSFVDLAPTLLSIIGLEAPDYMQGDAFLGKYKQKEPDYIYMFRDRMDGRYDMSRSIVDDQYRYTRNFNSNRIYLQHLEYLWRAPSMRSWEEAFKSGACNEVQARFWNTKPVEELYDTEKDPWEVNNLAGDPAHAGRLVTMREACYNLGVTLKDAGFIPEADRILRTAGTPAYDYVRSGALPYDQIIEPAWMATLADPEELEQLISLMGADDPTLRYWASQGLLLLGEDARPALSEIKKAAFDSSWNVSVSAAETLFRMGEKEVAHKALYRVLECDNAMARTIALNSIDHMNGSSEEFLEGCVTVLRNYDVLDRQYDARVAKWLLEKWEIDPASRNVDFDW
jgi:arylsulfatase A-like enzyme